MLGSPSEDGQADADKGALAGAVVVVVVGAVPEDQIVAVDHRRKQPGSPLIEPIIGHNNRYHHSALKKYIYISSSVASFERRKMVTAFLFLKNKNYIDKKKCRAWAGGRWRWSTAGGAGCAPSWRGASLPPATRTEEPPVSGRIPVEKKTGKNEKSLS